MPEPLNAARQRIAEAYSPELFGQLAASLSATLQQHFESVEAGQGPVLNWNLPDDNIALAQETLQQGGDVDASTRNRVFERLAKTAIDHGHNLHHPHYVGHQVPASVPIAGLFDALAAVTNQVMAIYEMGPFATAVERAVIERWGGRLGFEAGTFSGLITHGGSLANLTALLTARNIALKHSWQQGLSQRSRQPVLVAHAESHYGIARSAGILGLGTSQVVPVKLDDRRRMDPAHLDHVLGSLKRDGTPVIAVCASACATPIGAFDPLRQIAEICERHQVWLHVDAAHGGAVAFSDEHRHLIDGIELADSCVCDAHKMLFVPALCACVFYKRAADRFETFQQTAPYLFDPSAPGLAQVDSGLVTIECTKRAAALGLWGLWSLFGDQLFTDLVNVTFATARRLYEKLKAADDFEVLHAPQCNIVVFRFIPEQVRRENWEPARIGELNRQIRRRLMESGEFYLVQTQIDGAGALRVCVMNPLTDETHLDALLTSLRERGRQLLASVE